MHAASGTVFDIQRFCVHDGPGIRTTVFFKGCPLRCIWCHNPEGLARGAQIAYYSEKCLRCGLCRDVCPAHCHAVDADGHRMDRADCTACGLCSDACPSGALRKIGYATDADAIVQEVLKDRAFYRHSGGGVTLSGGEPLMQPRFAQSVLQQLRENGIHTCVETSGYCPQAVLARIVPLVDLFLFDIKETDAARHKQYTGVSNRLILSNLRYLFACGKSVILRCPIVPGCNDREEHCRKIADLANESPCVQAIHVEPYHPLGVVKWSSLGREAPYANPAFLDKVKAAEYAAYIQRFTRTEVR